MQLTPCDGTATSEKWCCGDTADCCSAVGAHKAVMIPRILSKESLAAAKDSGFKTYIDPNTYSRKKVNIGVGVGFALGGPLLFALGWLLSQYIVRRKNKPDDLGVVETTDVQWQEAFVKKPEETMTELETPKEELPTGEIGIELPCVRYV